MTGTLGTTEAPVPLADPAVVAGVLAALMTPDGQADPYPHYARLLEARQRLLTLLGAANRDPAVFPGPDRLVLDRSGEAALSFGGGIHYCLGAPLARLEAEVALPALLRRFPGLAISGPLVHRTGLALHGYRSVPVRTG